MPDTINNRAIRIFIVIGSPKISPPNKTPEIGIKKIKECNATAPYFCSKVSHATKQKEAVTRPWYNRAHRTMASTGAIMASSQTNPSKKNKGAENIMG